MKPTHVVAGVAYCLSPAETADTVTSSNLPFLPFPHRW
jgi:hypothetical protein